MSHCRCSQRLASSLSSPRSDREKGPCGHPSSWLVFGRWMTPLWALRSPGFGKILQLKESRQEEMNSQQGRVLRAIRTEPAELGLVCPFPPPSPRRIQERNWPWGQRGYREEADGHLPPLQRKRKWKQTLSSLGHSASETERTRCLYPRRRYGGSWIGKGCWREGLASKESCLRSSIVSSC